MGVSVREKLKGSNEWWIFVRQQGERVSERIGEKDLAQEAANEIRRDIRRGLFDLEAVKAARVQ